jgi:hypothetical protein
MKKLVITSMFAWAVLYVQAQTPPPEPPLEDYTGVYVFPPGSVVPDVDVMLSDGMLTMNSVAGSSSLTKLGIDTFSIDAFSGIAIFRRGEDKKVKSVYIEAMGYILEGDKAPGATGKSAFILYRFPANKELRLTGP